MNIAFEALLTALVIGLLLGPLAISLLRYLKFGQTIRSDGPARHLKKAGTPTMGGIIFLLAFALSVIVWGGESPVLSFFVATVLLFGLIGFVDDAIIIVLKRSLGLTVKQKLLCQVILSVIFVWMAVNVFGRGTDLVIPWLGHVDIGWFYYPLMVFYMVGVVNAVNLTDGLDGLAAGISFFVLSGFMLITALAANNAGGAEFRDLLIGAAALNGGVLAFLFFNHYPAKIFMGDTGSLALGAAVMSLSILTKTEVVFLLIGFVYLAEALSVILQVTSFRLTGKRIFLMSPLHHHFEMLGWPERKVVHVFWSVSLVGVVLGLILTTV